MGTHQGISVVMNIVAPQSGVSAPLGTLLFPLVLFVRGRAEGDAVAWPACARSPSVARKSRTECGLDPPHPKGKLRAIWEAGQAFPCASCVFVSLVALLPIPFTSRFRSAACCTSLGNLIARSNARRII